MKTKKLLLGSTILALSLIAGCSGGSETQTKADLHRVMDIASTTMETFKSDKEGDAALAEFNTEFEKNLNSMKPEAHPGPLGVTLEKDGSFHGYHDKNANKAKDSDEPEIFKLEIDTENKRILASDSSGRVADHSIAGMMGGLAGGLIAGMLIGSLLNRQRSSGVNTQSLGNKQANTARGGGSSSRSSSSSSNSSSARSRSGSGSHSAGK